MRMRRGCEVVIPYKKQTDGREDSVIGLLRDGSILVSYRSDRAYICYNAAILVQLRKKGCFYE